MTSDELPLPLRPHLVPCACDLCQKWAREIVATPRERRPPKSLAPTPARVEMPLAEIGRQMKATACRVLHMTEEVLRQKAEDLSAELPPVPVVERPSRKTVADRGVPELHLMAVYDQEPIACDALKAVQWLMDEKAKTLLVLSGGVGLRKTGSAAWALIGRPGVFLTAEELIRVSYTKTPEDDAAWRRLRSAGVLVIDDLGGEYLDEKGWSRRAVNGIIDYRYSNRLDTIITTNLHQERFKDSYGERVADRIREAGRWVMLGGTSVRLVRVK